MPKPSAVEAALDRLVALRANPSGAGVPDEIARGLGHRSDMVTTMAAIEALGIYRNDSAVRDRLKNATAKRGEDVQRAFARAFK